MMKLKNVLILVLAAFLSPLMISCSDSSSGGGNSDIPAAVSEKEGVDKINFPSEPFSLLGVYTVKTYAINGTGRAASNSELRVNVDITDPTAPVIQMRLSLNGVDNEFTKPLLLTEEDFKDLFGFIAKTFADLGAEVSTTDPYGLTFTMTGKQYPELVSSGIIGENDTLVLNLDKIRNLKAGDGLDYSDEDDNKGDDNSVKVESVSITDTPAKVTHGDAGFQLGAEVLPDNAGNKKLSWTSSHPKNAEVDSNGYVTIKDYTDETITVSAKTTDGSNKTAIYRFNMEKAQITGLSLAANSQTVQLRQDGSEVSVKIVPMVQPSYAEPYAAITYSSSNANVASVDANGKVIAKSAGSAAITVSVGTYKATFNITVQAAPAVTVAVTGITVTSAAKTYAKGETATVAFTLTPANTTETTVTYSGAASGSVIASNGSGTITLTNIQNSGTLTLTTEKNHKATYNLDARDRVTHISFTDSGWTVDQDSSAVHEIDKANDVKKSGTVTYVSADTNIATVNAATGQVTGKKNGVTTITATFAPAYTGTPITASYEIDVLGHIDYGDVNSLVGTYDIIFFGTKSNGSTSATDAIISNNCSLYIETFGTSDSCPKGTGGQEITNQNEFAGRAVIKLDSSNQLDIHTKIAFIGSSTIQSMSSNDQYQYTKYDPKSISTLMTTNTNTGNLSGRHLSAKTTSSNADYYIEKDKTYTGKTPLDILLYTKIKDKTVKVIINITLKPDTRVILRKISSQPQTMNPNTLSDEPFSKLQSKLTLNSAGNI